jgi:hypothetical protein
VISIGKVSNCVVITTCEYSINRFIRSGTHIYWWRNSNTSQHIYIYFFQNKKISIDVCRTFATHFLTKYYILLVYCEKWLGCRQACSRVSWGENFEKDSDLSSYLIFLHFQLVR